MPNFLSLPRELRDDIYSRLLGSSLVIKATKRPRIRISKRGQTARDPAYSGTCNSGAKHLGATSHNGEGADNKNTALAKDVSSLATDPCTDTTYYAGDEAVCYPSTKPDTPSDPLSQTNRQLRTEMQERIQKQPIHYKIRLAFREDKELLYPTWVSMPAFTDRIDALDCEIRIRRKKTASIFSNSSVASQTESNMYEGNVYFGGLVLLQRFLERGPSFLGKKDVATQSSLSIGIMTIHIVPKDLKIPKPAEEVFADTCQWVDDELLDKDEEPYYDDDWERVDEFLRVFVKKIDKFAIQVDDMRREWDLKEAMVERDVKIQRRRKRAWEAEETQRSMREEDERLARNRERNCASQ